MCSLTRSGRSLDPRCPVYAHIAGLRAVAFSPCGQRLATGGEDQKVILWDVQTGRAVLVLQGHTEWGIRAIGTVHSVSFSATGARVACGNWDGSICVWDATTGELLWTIHVWDRVEWVQFSPTDSESLTAVTILSEGLDAVSQWNVSSRERIRRFDGQRFAVYSPDGRTMATAGAPGTHDVLLFDAATGALRLRITSPQNEVMLATFSPDGSKLASACADKALEVWDSSTGALLHTFEIPAGPCSVSWGRDWVLDMQRLVAFAMGQHPRLGAGTQVFGLDEELLRMVLGRT